MANRWQSGFLRDDTTGALVVSGSAQSGSATPPPAGFVSGTTNTRRAMLAFGGGGLGNSGAQTYWVEGHQRFVAKLPITTTRWHIRIRNCSGNGTANTGALDVPGIYIGTAARAGTGEVNGSFTATPTQALSAFTLPSDGSEYVSGWVTDPALQFAADTDLLIAMGWKTAAGSQSISQSCGQVILSNAFGGANKSLDAALTTPVGGAVPSAAAVFDVRIVYEFTGTNLVGIAVGDSITEGQSGDASPSSVIAYHDQVWHQAFSKRAKVPMCSTAVFNTKATQWTSDTNWNWTRWAGLGLTIDFAVILLGSNDARDSTALATFQAQIGSLITNLRAVGVKSVYLATIPPRGALTHAYVAADVASGVTAFTVPRQIGGTLSGAITIGSGGTQETRTVSSVTGPSSGVYTVNVTVATSNAHAAGEYVAMAGEASRRDYNTWFRSMPFSIDGVLDFAGGMHVEGDPGLPDPVLVGADATHPTLAGYTQLGSLCAGVLLGRPA